MTHQPVLTWSDAHRRPVASRRKLALAPLPPSEDASRYQAVEMPPPTYNLDRQREALSLRALVILAIACMVTGAAIVYLQNFGMWLIP